MNSASIGSFPPPDCNRIHPCSVDIHLQSLLDAEQMPESSKVKITIQRGECFIHEKSTTKNNNNKGTSSTTTTKNKSQNKSYKSYPVAEWRQVDYEEGSILELKLCLSPSPLLSSSSSSYSSSSSSSPPALAASDSVPTFFYPLPFLPSSVQSIPSFHLSCLSPPHAVSLTRRTGEKRTRETARKSDTLLSPMRGDERSDDEIHYIPPGLSEQGDSLLYVRGAS